MSKDAQKYFDRFSGQWSGHYRSGGAMTDRLGRFCEALADLPPGSAILDYGCGTGEIARGLAEAEYQVSAVDISSGMVEQARSRPGADKVRFHLLTDPPRLPFEDGAFDAVASSSVLEYVPDPLPLLAELARVVKSGGRVLFTVPDPRHPIRRKEARLARVSRCGAAYALLRLTRWEAMHTYLRISCTRWSPEQWVEALSAHGFDAVAPQDCAHPLMMISARRR